MAYTNYSAGVASFGIPLPSALGPYLPSPSGKVFFVRSTTGRDMAQGPQGQDPSKPFASINFAVTQCVDSRADVIIVLPSHVETITAAAGLLLNKIGVWIVGVGVGRDKAQINFTTVVGASVSVTAARCRMQNLRFTLVGIDALTGPISVDAAEFEFLDNTVENANATNQATLGMLTTANASRLKVQRCKFHGTTDAGTTSVIRLVGAADDVEISDCVFYGAYGAGVGAIENITTATTNVRIINCLIDNRTASSTKAITLLAGTTGQISGCKMQILSGTAPITGAAMSWVGGNYYAAAIATAGTLI